MREPADASIYLQKNALMPYAHVPGNVVHKPFDQTSLQSIVWQTSKIPPKSGAIKFAASLCVCAKKIRPNIPIKLHTTISTSNQNRAMQ